MEISPEIITGSVAALLGAGGAGALIRHFWANRRQDSKQAHDQYRDLINDLREMNSELRGRVEVLEGDNKTCQEDRSRMNRELGALREAVNRMEGANVLAVITADVTGKICGWNHGAVALFGWTQDEVTGKDVDILIPERIREQHHAAFRKAAASPENTPLGTIQMRDSYGVHRNGSEFPVSIHLRRWASADGKAFFAAEIQKRT